MDLGVAGCRLVELGVQGDERGSLVAIEGSIGLPFAVARVYYIFATQPGVERGFHAHRKLRQWIIAVAGACTMTIDDGSHTTTVTLDRPDHALEIGPMTWREMRDFTPDCVLLVLADAAYDPNDYLRDHAAFVTEAAAGK